MAASCSCWYFESYSYNFLYSRWMVLIDVHGFGLFLDWCCSKFAASKPNIGVRTGEGKRLLWGPRKRRACLGRTMGFSPQGWARLDWSGEDTVNGGMDTNWLVVWNMFCIFHHMWDNPSHWLVFFKMVKTTNQLINGFTFFTSLIYNGCSILTSMANDNL